MVKKIVTRFAPSPTGYLHVGGARTALFNYLFARKNRGIFRLRIEDTDRERSKDEMTRQIFEGLTWLGLEWDGDVIHQGDNADRHRLAAENLIDREWAYRCFCTPADLEQRRAEAADTPMGYRYDGKCRHLSPGEIRENLQASKPFAIRFRVPEGQTSWEDGVHGKISIRNSELDDFIIMRSDGSPVYQLAVVADDHDMEITHVIRGDDHISNTPKQILLYQALGWQIPEFSHVPLILGPDGKRLSKRHGATAVDDYKQMGILPDAMFNFLALLGWTPGDDREIMSRPEIVENFSSQGIAKKSAVFDFTKLEWLNGEYLSARSAQSIAPAVFRLWEEAGFISSEEIAPRSEHLLQIVELLKSRVRLLNDYVKYGSYYFQNPRNYEQRGIQKHLKNPEVWDWLATALVNLGKLEKFEQAAIEETIRGTAEKSGIPAAKLIHPIRLALTGMTVSPGLFEVMEILGKDTVLDRLQAFIEKKEALQQGMLKEQE